jgi:UDP-N-acetyl-D-mannosaminuronate dehydrogenase
MDGKILVVGLGEIGKPLLEILKDHYEVLGIDVDPVEIQGEVNIMHICYPFEIKDFIGQTADYIIKYKPQLTIINSTVAPGTTREIFDRTGSPIAHSPVRGKHIKMRQELLNYSKYVGGITEEYSQIAAEHFQSVGMKTRILSSPEATELAKLTETTYFGLLIAWAQEVERFCDSYSLNYDEVSSFYEEIGFFPPVKYFPGIIGGHCVMPNIKILKKVFFSEILEFIEKSNQLKIKGEEK